MALSNSLSVLLSLHRFSRTIEMNSGGARRKKSMKNDRIIIHLRTNVFYSQLDHENGDLLYYV